MHSHNTGRYIQPYGHNVPTPNLQKLAEDGVVFRNAFAAAPTCSPSRAAFLTGMWAHSCGMLGLAHRGFSMKDYDLHCVRHFNQQGYYTVLAGVEHTAPDTTEIGYQQILTSSDPNYGGAGIDAATAAEGFIKGHPRQPFFLSLGLTETHIPFPDPDPQTYPAEDLRYARPPMPLPDNEITRRNMAAFVASARSMDAKFGRIIQAIHEAGMDEKTLIFCFSDHGLQFPRNMCNLTDHGTAVYCIARGPGGFTGGKVVDDLISLIDILPTCYEVAGIDCPIHVQGRSLTNVMETPHSIHREIIPSESNFHAAYEPMRGIRTERYKYIKRYDGREQPVLPNMDDGPSKDYLLESGWLEWPRDQEMLFDLVFDPSEAHNLIGDPTFSGVRDRLSTELFSWMKKTDDPILETGFIGLPDHCVVNDPDGASPNDTPGIF